MIKDEDLGTEVESEEEEVSEEDALLYSTYVGPRIFVMRDSHKTNVLGVLLEESDDSFLVGLPAIAASNNKKEIEIQPFAQVPYIRIMKSAIMTVSYTFSPWAEFYLNYLQIKGKELYPEIGDYIEEGHYEDHELVDSNVAVVPGNIEVSLSKESSGGILQGMSDDELRQYLLEKYNTGGVSIGTRKKQ